MNQQTRKIRIMISGGGTGGHIFPAVSIADEIRRREPRSEILFVGALGRMEMERVPEAGYQIVGLPVSGFKRKLTFSNLRVLWNALRSVRMAGKLIDDFKPDIAIGVGGYASGPLLRSAARKGIPTLLQEQNSYAGVTNKLLARRALKICVAYKNMEKYFPAEKIVLTGNPVRNLVIKDSLREEAYTHFGLKPGLPVLLVVGGSLGARTINRALLAGYSKLVDAKCQVIWQTGKYYAGEIRQALQGRESENIRVMDFISRMDLAYNAADLMISRAGAISISEICLTGRASILVPSPNVAEDHQTQNAMALVGEDAAVMVKDADAETLLIDEALSILEDNNRRTSLSANSKKLAKPDATVRIVDEVYKILNKA